MKSLKRFEVRRLFPNVQFGGMAFCAGVGAYDEIGIHVQIGMRIARVDSGCVYGCANGNRAACAEGDNRNCLASDPLYVRSMFRS